MRVEEARRLVREHRDRESLRCMYQRIAAEAARGSERLQLRPTELTEFQADLLRREGYKVEEEIEESGYQDRPLRLNWLVSWEQ